jgi:F0F1-type ATP synthase assembly protein I
MANDWEGFKKLKDGKTKEDDDNRLKSLEDEIKKLKDENEKQAKIIKDKAKKKDEENTESPSGGSSGTKPE